MRIVMTVHMRFPGAVGGLGRDILQMMCFEAAKKRRNASFPSQPEVCHIAIPISVHRLSAVPAPSFLE